MAGTSQFNGEVFNIESNINKVDSFDENISEDAAKQKYPSIECLKNMVHMVESGTSGIWNYRKWSDGTAECWGGCGYTFTSFTKDDSGLYASEYFSADFPTGLFIKDEIDIIASERFGTRSFYIVRKQWSYTTKENTGYYFIRANDIPTDTAEFVISYRASGRWK